MFDKIKSIIENDNFYIIEDEIKNKKHNIPDENLKDHIIIYNYANMEYYPKNIADKLVGHYRLKIKNILYNITPFFDGEGIVNNLFIWKYGNDEHSISIDDVKSFFGDIKGTLGDENNFKMLLFPEIKFKRKFMDRKQNDLRRVIRNIKDYKKSLNEYIKQKSSLDLEMEGLSSRFDSFLEYISANGFTLSNNCDYLNLKINDITATDVKAKGKPIKLGNIKFKLNLNTGELFFNGGDQESVNGKYHPHHLSDGKACTGTMAPELMEACANLSAPIIHVLIDNFAREYNSNDSAGKTWKFWDTVLCKRNGKKYKNSVVIYSDYLQDFVPKNQMVKTFKGDIIWTQDCITTSCGRYLHKDDKESYRNIIRDGKKRTYLISDLTYSTKMRKYIHNEDVLKHFKYGIVTKEWVDKKKEKEKEKSNVVPSLESSLVTTASAEKKEVKTEPEVKTTPIFKHQAKPVENTEEIEW